MIEVWLVVSLFVWSSLWTLFIIHCFKLCWRFRSAFWMKARMSAPSLIALCFLGAFYTWTRPYTLAMVLVRKGRPLRDLPTRDLFLYHLSTLSAIGPIMGMQLIIAIRIWHQFYEACFSIQIGLAEWRQIIDDTLINTNEMSFFLRNKSTFGNQRFLEKIAAIVWCLSVALVIIGTLTNHLAEMVTYLLSSAIIAVFVMLVAYYYPPFKDQIFLRREKKLGGLWAFFSLSTWFLWVLSGSVLGLDWDNDTKTLMFSAWSRQLFVVTIVPGLSVIICNVVIAQFVRPTMSVSFGFFSVPLAFDDYLVGNNKSNPPPILRSRSISSSISSSNGSGVRLRDILSDNNAFRAFMSHLFTEFSYENALCMIECIKFRERMIELHNSRNDQGRLGLTDHIDDDGGVLFSSQALCEDIRKTQSSFVEELTSFDNVRDVALNIYERYISVDGSYCVNLSHHIRQSTRDVLLGNSNNNEDTMIDYTLFDKVIVQCRAWLKESFSRFEKSNEFLSLTF